MADGINKVILIGNLGQDPELRYTGNGSPVCNMRVATNERWTKDGEQKESVEWHSIVVWGSQGEACNEYLRKGSMVYVEGKLQTRKWEDRDGSERYTTEVVARDVKFLDSKGGGESLADGYRRDNPGDDAPPPSTSGGGSDGIPF